MLSLLTLYIFHGIYRIYNGVISFLYTQLSAPPKPLSAHRELFPAHLGIILVVDEEIDVEAATDTLLQSIDNAAVWCHEVGILDLTVYDSKGILMKNSASVRKTVKPSRNLSSSYPLNTLRSMRISPGIARLRLDFAAMRSSQNTSWFPTGGRKEVTKKHHLQQKLQAEPTNAVVDGHQNIGSSSCPNPLTIRLVSPTSSKPAIASAACLLARSQQSQKVTPVKHKFQLSTDELDYILESQTGVPSLDFIVVHHMDPPCQRALELHGFPPWHLAVTEIFVTPLERDHTWKKRSMPATLLPLGKQAFCRALDEYSKTETRNGK
ncbi:hypothetical protein SERLA73DRAFT_173931 [Serpula lacrymans var. lacrymans S7.3]|uniref:ditrans,polycis-polyprenyl diphosphate synthase [(2E,6E)-farnesyldiphosphate specific] n=2 Tax=Serpula lacrymans var. lacrymans TaxID=341189 RepID=F8PFG5_SERL3|nr:uncharacterized protein SERLADRAFT_454882 [Serpula lacrymans var. lacrymans S7.9]EGO04734.1 hypothetical protein SERLA73DRAFT_173931 [Serpula lacrymans var. lacrymans S7.3]EGO30583.1 hypothetical protein SERLADRAFT_454882 [Serpula lacrymans var. lacrymans S7.9]